MAQNPNTIKIYFHYFYDKGLYQQYVIYRFHYRSDMVPVRKISRGLRIWIDEFTKQGLMPDQQVVILAHSMGGLVAKSYMQWQYHTFGRYACQQEGERVSKLITLATPHHGVPAANAEARIEEHADKTLPVILNILDLLLWLKDPDACKQALEEAGIDRFMQQDPISQFLNFLSLSQACRYVLPNEPSRSDLRYDNYDSRSLKYEQALERNEWLRALNQSFEYNKKIRAYYGAVDSQEPFYHKLVQMKPINVLASFIHYYANGTIPKDDPDNPYGREIVFFGKSKDAKHIQLLFASAMIKVLFGLENDGMVPSDSENFREKLLWKEPVFLEGYDHLNMKDDKREKLNGDAYQPKLFDLLNEDLQKIASTYHPDQWQKTVKKNDLALTDIIYFDVKTRFAEKREFVSVKAGLLAFIKHAEWAAIKDIGENYSVWLKDYTRRQNGSAVNIELILQIRTPAMFTHGKRLVEKSVQVSYDISKVPNRAGFQEGEMFGIVMEQLREQDLCPQIAMGDEVFATMSRIQTLGLGRAASPYEILEGMLVGAHLAVILQSSLGL